MVIDGGAVAGDNTGTADQNDPDGPGDEEVTVEGDATGADLWGTDGDDGDTWFSFVLLLYTSVAVYDPLCLDLGGRRLSKTKTLISWTSAANDFRASSGPTSAGRGINQNNFTGILAADEVIQPEIGSKTIRP